MIQIRENSEFIFRDTKIYFEKMLENLKKTFKVETSEYVSRIDYYEHEIREINHLITYFNQYLHPSKGFEFLVVYPKLKERFDDLDERKHGTTYLT